MKKDKDGKVHAEIKVESNSTANATVSANNTQAATPAQNTKA